MEITLVHSKKLILALVIIAICMFLWFGANRYVAQSQAKSEKVGISFEHKQIQVKWTEGEMETVPVNVFLTSNPKSKITGATIVVNYDPKKLDYLDKDELFVSKECLRGGFNFNRKIRVLHDSRVNGRLIVSRVVDPRIGASKLPSGLVCWGSLEFALLSYGKAKVSFEQSDLSEWEIVGPGNSYMPRFQEPSSTLISIIN